jgi:hypothetical protein
MTIQHMPNLSNYERARRDFSWDAVRAELSGLPGGRGLNIAYEAGSAMPRARCAIRSRFAGRESVPTNVETSLMRGSPRFPIGCRAARSLSWQRAGTGVALHDHAVEHRAGGGL